MFRKSSAVARLVGAVAVVATLVAMAGVGVAAGTPFSEEPGAALTEPQAPGIQATGNGCSAYALSIGQNYSAGLPYQIWARGTYSCPYRVTIKMTLFRDLLIDKVIAESAPFTGPAGTGVLAWGAFAYCGGYLTPRGRIGKYISKITITWRDSGGNTRSLSSKGDALVGC